MTSPVPSPVTSPAPPTLSQIRAWDTDHLRAAADYWAWGAEHWETVFTAAYESSARPGGHPWEGTAADQAQLRAYLDRMAVIGVADQMRAAAEAARTGAGLIDTAKRTVLREIDQAHRAGFLVGEDLSVSYPYPVTAAEVPVRQAQAMALAAQIHSAATKLVTADRDVATRISQSGAGVGALDFSEDVTVTPDLNDITTPPPDSLRGGGYWSVDTGKPHDCPEPIMGPPVTWERTLDSDGDNPALVGRRSAFADVVEPNYPGAGAEPVARLQESWQFRLVGESFNGSPDHMRWVRDNGQWYPAKWVDYRFTGIQQRAIATETDLLDPFNNMGVAGRPQPLSIQDIYRISGQNTRLTLSIPDICGPPTIIGSDAPSTTIPGTPLMKAPR